jgi:hypothetical protein
MAGWDNGGFSIVLMGNTNLPPSHCGDQGGVPFTTLESVPYIAEKPYIIKTDDGYSLMKPKLETDKVGPTKDWENADEIPFTRIYVASAENDTAETINA